MPHGTGHAGGGHHHGGGGGFHHHHHTSFGHHHHHHNVGYTGGPYYRYGYRRRSLGWGFFWLCIFGTAVALAVVFSVRYGAPDDNSSSVQYAPNETRSLTYSSIMCQSLTASFDWDGSYFDTSAEFFILSAKPPLSGHDMFSIHETPSLDYDGNYHSWNFYLYPESNFHMSVCKDSSLYNIKFYLIKGKGNFNNWVDNPSSGHAIKTLSIDALCSSNSWRNYTYNVPTEGEYYLVYYLNDYGSSSITVNMDFYRKKYVVDPNTVISNCTFGLSADSEVTSCRLDVSMDDSTALIVLSPFSDPETINWSSQISLDVYCGARVWVYVLISLVCVGFFLVIIALITVCCCCLFYRNKKKYTPLTRDTMSAPILTTPPPATATYATGNQPPPPAYNPSYGGTDNAPPKYYQ